MGHSFGGYISGNYCLKYGKHVKRLFLVSPVGLRVSCAAQLENDDKIDAATVKQDKKEENPCVQDMPSHIKLMFRMIWNQKISPHEVSRVFGKGWMMKILDEYMEYHIPHDEDLRALLKAYTYQIQMPENKSEYCLQVSFDEALRCYLPLGVQSKLGSNKFPVPVSIVLGDCDWVQGHDLGASRKIIKANKEAHGHLSNYYKCPSAGHTMNLDNPDAWVNIIINEVFYSEPSQKAQRLPILTKEQYKTNSPYIPNMELTQDYEMFDQ